DLGRVVARARPEPRAPRRLLGQGAGGDRLAGVPPPLPGGAGRGSRPLPPARAGRPRSPRRGAHPPLLVRLQRRDPLPPHPPARPHPPPGRLTPPPRALAAATAAPPPRRTRPEERAVPHAARRQGSRHGSPHPRQLTVRRTFQARTTPVSRGSRGRRRRRGRAW